MDETAIDISFDVYGVCNYCTSFEKSIQLRKSKHSVYDIQPFIDKIKRDGKGKRYDCIIGVSGGVDSSWVLVESIKRGLRPLAVHMDNGWNSELAQNNISNLVGTLGVDFYTHVIDWSEYKSLMQSFFDSDVIDIELLYDNAMLAVNFQLAKKYGVKYILGGTNQATEGMVIPPNWVWFKYDKRNIYDINQKHQNIKIKSLPTISFKSLILYQFISNIKWYSFLDYIEFNKADAMKNLVSDYGYKPYEYKHYESIFTRFYQGYILPKKFNVDKRKVHFSTLIVTGQMSREDAISDLNSSVGYKNESDLKNDIAYFLKKMEWSESNLKEYLERPEKPHTTYKSEIETYRLVMKINKHLKSYK